MSTKLEQAWVTIGSKLRLDTKHHLELHLKDLEIDRLDATIERYSSALTTANLRIAESASHINARDALIREQNKEIDTLRHELRRKHIEPTKGKDRPNRKKLQAWEVQDIRGMYRAGFKQSEIADSYDVNRATISRIVRGQYHK